MAETHVISGLKTKRAEIAGLLAECDERRAALKEALATIDAALRLFAYEGDPAEIKAKRKRRWMFKRGELQRAVMDALRAAHLLHFLVGLLGYAIGWMFVAEPIARRFAPSLPTLAAAAIYGVVLWVFALFVMAHLVVGMPAFLGFTEITWVALVGHVIYAVVLADAVEARSIWTQFNDNPAE